MAADADTVIKPLIPQQTALARILGALEGNGAKVWGSTPPVILPVVLIRFFI